MNPASGLRSVKNRMLHRKLAISCKTHSRMIPLCCRRTMRRPSESPMQRYRTLQAIGNTILCGVSVGLVSVGYHSAMDEAWKKLAEIPTAKQARTGMR